MSHTAFVRFHRYDMSTIKFHLGRKLEITAIFHCTVFLRSSYSYTALLDEIARFVFD